MKIFFKIFLLTFARRICDGNESACKAAVVWEDRAAGSPETTRDFESLNRGIITTSWALMRHVAKNAG